MRDEVLMDLVDRAMDDADFRAKAQKDPEATLKEYGYDLNDEELQAVKEFQAETAEMSDEELTSAIAGGAKRRAGG